MAARVLIIDDNRDLAESLAELLEIEGFDVDIAHSGAETWDKLDNNQYHYCLTDIKLPDTNGIEIYNRAKATIPEHNIIAISGFRIEQIISSVFETSNVEILNLDDDANALSRANLEPGAVSLIICNHDRHCLDEDRLPGYGIDNYQLMGTQDINVVPGKTIYIFNTEEQAISALAQAYEIHKNNITSSFIILLPSNTGIQGNPLQSYDLTGILFKPFSMTDFMGLLVKDNQVSMTLRQG